MRLYLPYPLRTPGIMLIWALCLRSVWPMARRDIARVAAQGAAPTADHGWRKRVIPEGALLMPAMARPGEEGAAWGVRVVVERRHKDALAGVRLAKGEDPKAARLDHVAGTQRRAWWPILVTHTDLPARP